MALGPCAKQRVKCDIISREGHLFTGYNDCDNPQDTCPRDAGGYASGEGYHLCQDVCQQQGHAEEVAIDAMVVSGIHMTEPLAIIDGHTHVCTICTQHLSALGVDNVITTSRKNI